MLKLVGILWNRTSVEVVDKLSSTSVDFIRSERELVNLPKSSNHWLASPHTISTAPKTLWNRSNTSLWHLENVSALMMCLPCSPQSQ